MTNEIFLLACVIPAAALILLAGIIFALACIGAGMADDREGTR